MLEISPKGTVPILLPIGIKVIQESMDIIYYATQESSQFKMGQYSLEKQEQIKNLISDNDTEFVKLVRYYKYPDRYPEESQGHCREEIQSKFLDVYEQMLQNQPFLFGEKSIADIAIISMVRQFALVNPDWFFNSKYSNIIRWLNGFIENDIFKNIVMAKNPPWQEGETPIYLFETAIK
jgi:glutathione S-transferase